MIARLLSGLLLIFAALPAFAQDATPRLVPDVSQRNVNIQSRFTGTELLLFGAIIYPRGVTPEDRIDVVVVLRGPTRPVRLREKQKVAGIWINAESIDLRSAPTYYAIATSRPLNEIVDRKTSAIYELGLDSLQLSPSGEINSRDMKRFRAGLVNLNTRTGLYTETPAAVDVVGDVLYRARLNIPSSVPEGRYVAETLLIRGGKVVVANDDVSVTISKAGFDLFVTILAQKYALIYGAIAVLVSLLLGWMAGVIFGRL